ncbi:MAG: hypothetical protein AB8B74_08345 [Crocinitomicaceae bacterium]
MKERQIRFIWDFFGADGLETAIHHAKHLTTFFTLNRVDFTNIGSEKEGELKSIAFVVSSEKNVELIKKSLRPHRATIES